MLLIDFILVPHFCFYFYYFHILAFLLFSLKILGEELSSLVFLLSLFFFALIYTFRVDTCSLSFALAAAWAY